MTLPVGNEPLILADGTKIDPSSGKVIKDRQDRGGFVEIPSASQAVAIVSRTRKAVADLPLPSNQMNVVSLVLFYSMYGLNIQDVAIILNLSIEQVQNIQKLPEFKKFSDEICKTVLEHEANDIRMYMQQNATVAARKIVDIAQDDEGVLGFKAAQDILDRAGFRPADIVEHKHSMEGGLRIEFVDKGQSSNLPSMEFDGDYKDITNADRA